MSSLREQKLEDIEYELQLLFGADKIVSQIEICDNAQTEDNKKFGNIINYFKDSIYLHSRNLLNLTTQQGQTEVGKVPANIHSAIYKKLKPAIERYVTHLKQARDQSGQSNTVGGKHLNEYTHLLVCETRRCFMEWIDTLQGDNKTKLQKILSNAENNALNDTSKLMKLLEINS